MNNQITFVVVLIYNISDKNKQVLNIVLNVYNFFIDIKIKLK